LPAKLRKRRTHHKHHSKKAGTLMDSDNSPPKKRLKKIKTADAVGHDETGLSKRVLKTTWRLYTAMVMTKAPFPTSNEEDKMSREAWKMACEEREVDLPATEDILANVRTFTTSES
jgi:hypothetical protein